MPFVLDHAATLQSLTLCHCIGTFSKVQRKEYLVYAGPAFTIEWYFDAQGSSQPLAYFDALAEDRQDEALFLFRRMGDHGKIFDLRKFRNEGDAIFAFKPQPDRYLCFFVTGRKIVITNAFHKKSQKLPVEEKRKALKAKADYEQRAQKRGIYYEEH